MKNILYRRWKNKNKNNNIRETEDDEYAKRNTGHLVSPTTNERIRIPDTSSSPPKTTIPYKQDTIDRRACPPPSHSAVHEIITYPYFSLPRRPTPSSTCTQVYTYYLVHDIYHILYNILYGAEPKTVLTYIKANKLQIIISGTYIIIRMCFIQV